MPTIAAVATHFHAVVPCAGRGTRAGLGEAKQYVPLLGRPMVSHTLDALAGVARLASIVVVVAPDDADFARRVPLPDARFAVSRCGGASRSGSVAAGLAELARSGASASDWVLVHDAARCLVRAAWIDALIDACRDDAVGGLLACRVADTLKREAGGRAAATVSRDHLWQAQTPQMFRLGVLAEALAKAGEGVTDEAGAIEAIGLAPQLVAAPAENFKLTQAADFAVAAAILQTRRP